MTFGLWYFTLLSRTLKRRRVHMQKHFHNLVLGVSVLPALLVMPAMAEYTDIINIQNDTDLTITENVNITNGNGHGILVASPSDNITAGSVLTINADTVNVSADRAAILAQHRTENDPNEDPTKVLITADTINLIGQNGGGGNSRSSDGYGVVSAMSQGIIELKGNTTITANPNLNNDAILARGNAVVKINENTTDKTTKINGNIDFNYNDKTSGSTVNANVDVTLNGSESYWTGNTVMSYDTKKNATKMHQNETTIRLKNGAIWNAVAISDIETDTDGGYFYTALNNLNVNKGTVNIADTTRGITVENANVADATFSGGPLNVGIMTVSGGTNTFNTSAVNVDAGGELTVSGGATTFDGSRLVVNHGASLVVDAEEKTNFINGAGTRFGSIISNSGTTTISNATFSNNKTSAGGYGGAIYNSEGLLTINNSVFKDNTATWDGGAISGSTSYISSKPADFTADVINESTVRAYWQSKTGFDAKNKIVINNSTFDNNKATVYSGGAVSVYSDAVITNSHFKNNTANGNDPVDPTDGGGAIYAGGWARLDITGGDFINNTSNYGGAISTTRAGKENGVYMHIKGAEFEKNTATVNGGAISNNFEDTVLTDVTFKNNTAAENGGAVYNANYNAKFSVIDLKGTNIFTGNTAAGKANDIHNLGIVNIVSGTTTLDGGITGSGALTIASGAELNIGTASIVQGTMSLDGTLNATLLNTNKFASLDVANFASQEGSMNLTLKGVGDYKVFEHAIFDNSNIALVYDDTLFAAPVWNEAKDTITVSMKPVEEIAADTGLKGETAAAVSHVAQAASNSDSVVLQELSLKLQEKLAEGDTAAVEHATKAVHPETESVAQSVSTSVQNTVVSLASARMSAPSVGRNGGDVEFTSGGVWAQGLFNKSKQDDAFNGYTRGIALGMDGTINKDWTVGAGYSFAHTDISGTARNTEIDSNTVFVYGQYKPAQWYVNAIANYTMSDYSERGTVLDGITVTGDYSVDSFGGALATGYDFANGITPELGLRYMHVNANDYANSYGIKTHMDDTDFLTGVVGARYAFDIAATRHVKFAPQLSAAMKYDMLSDKNIATVTMPGLNAYTLEGNRLKRIGAEFGIGLGMQYRELNVSVNYDIDVREDYTSQTGMLKFRYNF